MAEELARRLSEQGLGMFEARNDTVNREHQAFVVPLVVISAGRGRPYEVERALRKAEGLAAPVVVGEEFGPGALGLLARAEANHMDRRRLFIRMQAPEFLVRVIDGDEQPVATTGGARRSLAGAAGAVAIALLERPDHSFRVTRLADELHLSPATVQEVVFALEAEGLLLSHGKGPQKERKLTDPSALLDRYSADAMKDRRRAVRLRVLADEPLVLAKQVADGLREANVRFALTGMLAASVVAPHLTRTSQVEAWVDGPRTPEYLTRALEALPSDEGANVVLWRAGTRGPLAGAESDGEIGVTLASRFRVYADLLANPGRGREQAAVFREQVIRF